MGLGFQTRILTLCADLHASQLPSLPWRGLAHGLPAPSRVLVSRPQHMGWGLQDIAQALYWSDRGKDGQLEPGGLLCSAAS